MDLIRLAAVEALKLIQMGIINPTPNNYQIPTTMVNSLDDVFKTIWNADFFGCLVLGDLKINGWHGLSGSNFKPVGVHSHVNQDYNRVHINPYDTHIQALRLGTINKGVYPKFYDLQYRERIIKILQEIYKKGENFNS